MRFVRFAMAVAIASGCGGSEASTLQQRAAERPVSAPDRAASSPPDTPPTAAKTQPRRGAETLPEAAPPTAAPTTPPPPSERVTLALALDEAVEYRTSVVGMVAFPMSQQATGYAREEKVVLSACEGEGTARTCTLQHSFTGFEAEPPAGRFLQADYDRYAHVVSTHALAADGSRPTPVSLAPAPDAAPIDETLAAELGQVHGLFCLRFPREPVGVGAKWSDTCETLTTGRVGKRNVVWELSKLEDDPEGGKRAELSYVGQYTEMVDDKDGKPQERKGTIQGTLYFFVDDGHPHLMREKIELQLGQTAAVTKTSVNIQFARPDPSDETARIRTDGKPFPAPSLVQQPTSTAG